MRLLSGPLCAVVLVACPAGEVPSRIYFGPPGTTETHAVVQVGQGSATGVIHQLRATITIQNETKVALFPSEPAGPLTFPQTFAVAARGRTGPVNVVLETLGQGGQVLEPHAAGSVELVSQQPARLTLNLWRCGDALANPDEQCDDGNTNPADACDTCRRVRWTSEVQVSGSVEGRNALGVGVQAREVATDLNGRVYIAEQFAHRIRRLDPDGTLTTVAGTGVAGYAGDGDQATSARLSYPQDIAVDGLGRLYIADSFNLRVRRVDVDGIITTVAGTGGPFPIGDGKLAVHATMSPGSIAVDTQGQLYIADLSNHSIYKVDLDGLITTVAGSGVAGFFGDRGLAINARFNSIESIAVDLDGSIYVADSLNHRVRRVAPDGLITTIAGNGAEGIAGDGGDATLAQLGYPKGVATDFFGRVFISSEQRLRVVTPDGLISTFAGADYDEFTGDGGPAVDAGFFGMQGVAVDPVGQVYVVDTENYRIRKIGLDGIINTVAGTGRPTRNSEGDQGTSVQVVPLALSVDAAHRVYIADHYRVRRLDPDGTMITVAGDGTLGPQGSGGPAVEAHIWTPTGLAVDSRGRLLVSEVRFGRVRRIELDGTIWGFAGTSPVGFGGDNGPAVDAHLDYPAGLAVDSRDRVYIADRDNNRIRRVDQFGIITTYAGTGVPGFSGDGAAAVDAQLNRPTGVAFDLQGRLHIADSSNYRIRRVEEDGTITTVVGTGVGGSSGDEGPAVEAQLLGADGITFGPDGTLYIAEQYGFAVRKVGPDGIIHKVAGNGTRGTGGDGRPAVNAELAIPVGVAFDPVNGLYVADSFTGIVRRVDLNGIIWSVAGLVCPPGPGPLAQSALWNPRSLLQLDGMTLAAGGAGRVSRVTADGVTAVVGLPTPAPVPSAQRRLAAFSEPLRSPVAVALHPSRTRLFVSQQPGESAPPLRVVRVDADEDGVVDDAATWTMEDVDLPARVELQGPAALGFDPLTGALLVADEKAHCIWRIDVDGQGDAEVIAGVCGVSGFFGNHLLLPSGVLAAPSGAVYVSDTGNNRILRIPPHGGIPELVVGDGSTSSAGDGSPAQRFSVNRPAQLALDSLGNLYVATRTAVRVVTRSDVTGEAGGDGAISTIYRGGADAPSFPQNASICLAGLALEDDQHVLVADACQGFMLRLTRSTEAP